MTLDSLTRSLRPDQSIFTLLVQHDPKAVQDFLASLSPLESLAFTYRWPYFRRPMQVTPPNPWSTWVIMGGRGTGKTRPGAEQVIEWARELGPHYRQPRIALIGKDPHDLRTIMIEGESGILQCSPPWFRPRWEPTKQQLTWDNGVIAHTYSAEVPEDLRGPNIYKGWCDELPKWRYAQEAWDVYQFTLRLGSNPQTVLTTTPRPIPVLLSILRDPETVVTRGTTDDNFANLSQRFMDTIYRKYAGTRLGRQELNAELLTDTPGALWTLDMIDATRVHEHPPLDKIALAIDPGVSDPDEQAQTDTPHAETGLSVVGRGEDAQYYVLYDLSDHFSANTWASKAVSHAHAIQADEIIGEQNNGGDLVKAVIQTASEALGIPVKYRKVWASRGKRTRAEPIAALYEQRRQHHVGSFPDLEDQMTTWVPGMRSPDRMDAMVWASTAVALDDTEPPQSSATW